MSLLLLLLLLCGRAVRDRYSLLVVSISTTPNIISLLPRDAIGNESAPLAQCWFPRLAIFNARILIYFSNEIYGSNFIKQQSEIVMV